MTRFVVAVVAVITSSSAASSYDCPTIRQFVARYGVAAAKVWALANGYSLADIQRAQRACFGRAKQ